MIYGYILFYIKVIYLKDKLLLESGIETYVKFDKNNVREIDWNYLILTIIKRLFTMKVENHDTTKLGNQHENLLKREIQKINVNKYQTLFNNVRTRVL
jgi:hypothetical protein